jgi:hypothetical protein
LSYHTFLFSDSIYLSDPKLPSVDLKSLSVFTGRLIESSKELARVQEKAPDSAEAKSAAVNEAQHLHALREQIAAAFSSVAVMNASFHNLHTKTFTSSSLTINLEQVRRAYEHLVRTENDQVLSTLGRATLQLSDMLKECPFDDPENLSVFLIVMENPLLLKPILFQVVLERIVTGILALPKACRLQLFGWLKLYDSEYFSRVLHVLQNFLSYCLSSKSGNPAPTVIVLQSLYDCNKDAHIIPEWMFYNDSIPQRIDIVEEWNRFKSSASTSSVFNFCGYIFLLNTVCKSTLVRVEANELMKHQSNSLTNKYFIQRSSGSVIPRHIGYSLETDIAVPSSQISVSLWLQLNVRREFLLEDTIEQISRAYIEDKDSLKLPLRLYLY